jgi:hypothetical protein
MLLTQLYGGILSPGSREGIQNGIAASGGGTTSRIGCGDRPVVHADRLMSYNVMMRLGQVFEKQIRIVAMTLDSG